jgi:radical SAM superfamily enzyme YgiQ (UPF0313 family)
VQRRGKAYFSWVKSRKVLMVQPRTPRTFWTLDDLVKAGGYKTFMPPLGLMTVAALVPDRYQVRILDLNTTPLDAGQLAWADLVFVTGMYIHHQSFVEVVRLAKSLGKTVVAGGPLAIAEWTQNGSRHDDRFEMNRVDHLVLYEAEVNLPLFLRDFERGKASRVYASKEHPDLSATPPPRFDLINVKDYLVMTLQFSRGCPHDCDFCDIVKMFGRVPRTKSIAGFIEEIESLYATGFRGLLFVADDNFIGNRKAVKRLLERLTVWQERRDYPFMLYTQTALDVANDDELLAAMVKAGFGEIFVGVETPDIETLLASNKRVNTHIEMDRAVEKIQRAGIAVAGGFIVGFDTDSPDIFRRQIDFMQSAGIPRSMFSVLSPIPGTELYERLEREGRILEDEAWKATTGDNFVPTLLYVPTMPVEQFLSGCKLVISEIYDPRRYYERSLTLISRLPDLKVRDLMRADRSRRKRAESKARVSPLTFSLLAQLLRIFFTPHGLLYARFLARSASHGLMSLAYAFNLALSGEHFFIVRDRIIETLGPEYIRTTEARVARKRGQPVQVRASGEA